ncbi:phosphatidate cytidylyltransferase [Microvirga terrae]|uniref:Phosphatidate cytidylyltransferase n=1 Tax=Microvirga terrae TaxID=2740529 RepID=A0ABY5RJQ1_9HYPH|nr:MULTISPECIES: phosphatidate cytidylyltransferase [Microvirga]MBQ0822943.1 phosphatidate cytidylyltransferase [Microvirga sp. HBU67558]UVF17433.1 phosphatidate cytidylyltransferase [Microvirga terrae]
MVADQGSSLPTRPKSTSSRELTTRVLSAIVMIAAALLTAYWGGWPFALFWLAAGTAVMVEWTRMTGAEPRPLVQSILAVGLAVLTVLFLTEARFGLFLLAGLVFLVTGTFATGGGANRIWSASGFLYASLIVLVPPIVRDHVELGILGLLWMFAVVWATDIAAYFTGRTFGGPKLCPPISPKKTWSGFVGGVVAAALCGVLVAWTGEAYGHSLPLGLPAIAILSVVASVASQIGDLGESALKRHCNVKDSSHLIPGHGGVMDRLDGFWAVCLIVGAILLTIHFTP